MLDDINVLYATLRNYGDIKNEASDDFIKSTKLDSWRDVERQ